MKFNNIYVVGMGFVGLTTAIGLAKKGFQIIGLENNKNKLEELKKNNIPFYEPYLKKNLILAKKLFFFFIKL